MRQTSRLWNFMASRELLRLIKNSATIRVLRYFLNLGFWKSMLSQEKLSHIIAVALLLIAVQIIAFVEYFDIADQKENSLSNPQRCTQEAMQCPDGSYVGRTEPNCEFAECSGVKLTGDECVSSGGKIVNTLGFEEWNQEDYIADVVGMKCSCICVKDKNISDTSSWQTYRNEEYGFEVKYPSHITVKEYSTREGLRRYFGVCFQVKKDSGTQCFEPHIEVEVLHKSFKNGELQYAN